MEVRKAAPQDLPDATSIVACRPYSKGTYERRPSRGTPSTQPVRALGPLPAALEPDAPRLERQTGHAGFSATSSNDELAAEDRSDLRSSGGASLPLRSKPAARPDSSWRAILGISEADPTTDVPIIVKSASTCTLASSAMVSAPGTAAPTATSVAFGAPGRPTPRLGRRSAGRVEVLTRQGRPGGRNAAPLDLGDPPGALRSGCGWERVEWTLSGLQKEPHSENLRHNGQEVFAGQYISSRGFKIFDEEGHLRFWPSGYYNASQVKGGRHNSGCAVSLVMASGSHLRLRFFASSSRSRVREVYWNGHADNTMWMLEDNVSFRFDGSDFVVGVEVFHNFRQLRPGEATPLAAKRCVLVPLKTPRLGAPGMGEKVEALMRVSTWLRRPRHERSCEPLGLAPLPSPRFGLLPELR